MGEIRIIGPGKTRGYPYLVCMNTRYSTCYAAPLHVLLRYLRPMNSDKSILRQQYLRVGDWFI